MSSAPALIHTMIPSDRRGEHREQLADEQRVDRHGGGDHLDDLVRFLLDQLRQHHAGEQQGQEEQQHLADLRGQRAVLGERARRGSRSRSRQIAAALSPSAARVGEDQPELADGRPRPRRPRRSSCGWSRPPVSTARTGGSRDGEQPLLLRGDVGLGRDSDQLDQPVVADARRASRSRAAEQPVELGLRRDHGDDRPLGLAGDAARRCRRTRRRAAAGTAARAGRR